MPTYITFGFSVIAAIMLFLYGLASFSSELTHLGGSRFQVTLRKLTRTDTKAALMGALATALVQSSSAITAMATGLAYKATLTNRSAFAIMIGANVGTTFTAWLVAFQIVGLGPVFVSIGGIVSFAAPMHLRPYGKAIFYFGLVFLALDLISQALSPIRHHAALAQWQVFLHMPIFALLFAALLTALVQSSSVVTGLAVLLVQQNILPAETAVWLVMGSNIGTTSTALLASAALNKIARRLALLNTIFNIFGVLLFVTMLQPVIGIVMASEFLPDQKVAILHSLFNLTAAISALATLPFVWHRLEFWLEQKDAT
jgi:phosphate:Na+ symporter